jgi:hypothetical protein
MCPNSVNTALTPNSLNGSSSTQRPARSRKRRSSVENDDYAAFARRIIRAHGRRIAEGDVDGLADLLTLQAELNAATQTAVNGLRAFGYSWAEVAARLGVTRQAAQQRWGGFQ